MPWAGSQTWVAQGKEVHMSITAGVVDRYHLNPPTH
ncbi:hypothetical protein BN979_06714 [Mycolicibacterium vulneris]|nr:hypothetical protein BN979_06714 [Mycolicibacterium vulneris]